MRVRRAEPDDALAVAGVHVRSWQVAYRGPIDDQFLDHLRAEDRAPTYSLDAFGPDGPEMILAVEGDEVLGFAVLGPLPRRRCARARRGLRFLRRPAALGPGSRPPVDA